MVGHGAVCFAGSAFGFRDLCWAYLAISLMSWMAFLPLLLHRLIIGDPKLPAAMGPSLAILISAPAINALAWFAVTGAVDASYRILAFVALFFVLVVVALKPLSSASGFSISWWAFTFPAAALASTFVRLFVASPSTTNAALAMATLLGATFVVLAVWVGALRSALGFVVRAS